MGEYFESIERQERLHAILESWLDTPFRHHAGVKGVGTDCIFLLVRVLEEMGIIRVTKDMIPDYPRDWHMHNTREILIEKIFKHLNVKKIDKGEAFKNGDILLFHIGGAAAHIGIYHSSVIYQSLVQGGVCKLNVEDRLMKRQLRYAVRIME